MRLKDKIIDISRWDSYSCVILLLIFLFQVIRWATLPIFVDIYYHLFTARGFYEAGGWVSSCFWEYAPVGRAQLYPPLLHFLILFLIKLNIPLLVIGKIFQLAIYPLLVLTIWYVVREIFNKRQAFFTVFLISSIYSFFLTAINTLAASLSLIFCLLSLLFFERNKKIMSSVCLSLAFYTHGYTPWLFVSVFLLYGIFNKEKFVSCLKVILGAFIIAGPFLLFQFLHKHYFCFQRDIVENYYIELNLLDWFIFPFGLMACLKRKNKSLILVSFFISSLVLLLSGTIFRFLSYYGIMSIVLMNAVFLDNFFVRLTTNRQKRLFGTLIILLFFIFAPTLTMDRSKRESTATNIIFSKDTIPMLNHRLNLVFDGMDSNAVNFISYRSRKNLRGNEVTIYFPHIFGEVVDVIERNSKEDDIIYSNFSYTAGILGLLSHRAISTAMLSEIMPYRNFDKVAVSKLIIWQKDPDDMKQEPVQLIEKYQLKKIKDTKLAFIYENPKCIFKKQTLTAAISYKILFMLVFLIFALIVCSVKLRLTNI